MFIRFFEHIRTGEQTGLGSHRFSRGEMIAYASRYDPQPFHVDDEAAGRSVFRGLIASGWHTAAVCQRLTVSKRNELEEQTTPPGRGFHARLGPSPGFRQLQWLKPVYAQHVIDFSSRVVEKAELKARPEWGIVTSRSEGRNRTGDLVFGVTVQFYVERTPA